MIKNVVVPLAAVILLALLCAIMVPIIVDRGVESAKAQAKWEAENIQEVCQKILPENSTNVQAIGNNWIVFDLRVGNKTYKMLYRISNTFHRETITKLEECENESNVVRGN